MPDNVKRYHRMNELILIAIEGEISGEQKEELNRLIIEHPEARHYYLDYVDNYIDVSQMAYILKKEMDDASDYNVLHEVIEQDLNDSAIRNSIKAAVSKPSADRHRLYKRRELSNWGRILILAKLAAVILIAVSVVLLDRWFQKITNHPKPVVAVLRDQVRADWEHAYDLPRASGDMTQGYYSLSHGYARIEFDCGADIVLEGPAAWQLKDEDRMYLHQGKLYAKVPRRAMGFTILTDNAKIIDLGTEFGVDAGRPGSVEVHVTKGKVSLLTGSSSHWDYQEEVSEGLARTIDHSGNIRPVALDAQRFVNRVDTDRNMVWRQHPTTTVDAVVYDLLGRPYNPDIGAPWGGHEGLPHGIPAYWDWYKGVLPVRWMDNGNYQAVNVGGRVFEWAEGSPVKNVRIQVRNVKFYAFVDGEWIILSQANDYNQFGFSFNRRDFSQSVQMSDIRSEESNGGGISFTMESGYDFHWWAKKWPRASVPEGVQAYYSMAEMRLIPNTNEDIDLSRARYLARIGNTYFPTSTKIEETENCEVMSNARFRFLRPEWQVFTTYVGGDLPTSEKDYRDIILSRPLPPGVINPEGYSLK